MLFGHVVETNNAIHHLDEFASAAETQDLVSITGIVLGNDASLLSEIRASGGALLVFGMLIMAGAFVANLRFTAILVTTLLYISYGFSRILSMVIDGMPDTGLVQVTVLEIVIGLVCCFALIKYRESHYE
ncbi:MAG: hypothetical protein COB78_02885 [Hyphomicrobiales bacterium]|nr:MAG: hypothetical protein COB78_02885 [Hyphomicrobiales bacterium]